MHSLIHTPAAYPFIHPTINSSIYPFIHSPTCHPFIQLFIHSLIYPSIHPATYFFPLLINSLIHNSSTCFMYVCVYIYTTYFTPSIKNIYLSIHLYRNKLNNLILFLTQYLHSIKYSVMQSRVVDFIIRFYLRSRIVWE